MAAWLLLIWIMPAAVTNNGTITATGAATAVEINDNGIVANNTTITVGDNGIGIRGCQSQPDHQCAGSITAGAGGVAISVGDNNVVTNTGTLATGTGGTGIFAGVNNTITNAATGIITVTDNGSGIFVAGNSTVMNAGSHSVALDGRFLGRHPGDQRLQHDYQCGGRHHQRRQRCRWHHRRRVNDATVRNAGSITTVDTPALLCRAIVP